MHFTEPVYRNPYWPTWPLLEVTAGCTHNKCKFCTMYKGVRFGVPSMEQIEEDLAELSATVPHVRTLQLLSANPLALPYDRMAPILEKVNEYLPDIEHVLRDVFDLPAAWKVVAVPSVVRWEHLRSAVRPQSEIPAGGKASRRGVA